jgi:transposase
MWQGKRSKSRGPQQAQEAIRQRAMAAIKRGRRSMKAVAETFGVSYSAVRKWNQKHAAGGRKALVSARRGRKTGEGR